MQVLICQTVVRPTLLYSCETWPKTKVNGNNVIDEDGLICNGLSLLFGEIRTSWRKPGGIDSDGHVKEKVGMIRAR